MINVGRPDVSIEGPARAQTDPIMHEYCLGPDTDMLPTPSLSLLASEPDRTRSRHLNDWR